MLLGLPVVATAYSGNADFLTPDTGFPVAYRLVPVGPGDYPFGEGLLWADPDPGDLAANLRLVFDQPGLAKRRAEAGRRLVASRHNHQVVGQAYRQRLLDIAGRPPARAQNRNAPCAH